MTSTSLESMRVYEELTPFGVNKVLFITCMAWSIFFPWRKSYNLSLLSDRLANICARYISDTEREISFKCKRLVYLHCANLKKVWFPTGIALWITKEFVQHQTSLFGFWRKKCKSKSLMEMKSYEIGMFGMSAETKNCRVSKKTCQLRINPNSQNRLRNNRI